MTITRLALDGLYSTSDLSAAAFLALKTKVEAIDKTNPRKVTFFFKKTKNLEDLVEDFWQGRALVDPLKYFHQLRLLKSRIYEKY